MKGRERGNWEEAREQAKAGDEKLFILCWSIFVEGVKRELVR